MHYDSCGNTKQAELNLYSCGKDTSLSPGEKCGPVIRDAYIIECCIGGYGTMEVNHQQFCVQEGDCYVLRPGDVVSQTAAEDEPRQDVWCMVTGDRIEHYLRAVGVTSLTPFAPKEAFPAIREQLEQILLLGNDTDAGAELRRNAHLHMLFGELMRYAPREVSGGQHVEKALHYMEMHYSEDLTVQELARTLGLDRSYFSTLFQQHTGKTPHAYLNALRVRKACLLLDDGQLSVSEIAQAVGIDPVRFAQVFEKHTGILPGKYRSRSRQT